MKRKEIKNKKGKIVKWCGDDNSGSEVSSDKLMNFILKRKYLKIKIPNSSLSTGFTQTVKSVELKFTS